MKKDKEIVKVKFRIFRAIEDPASCLLYLEGHRRVLEDHGFSNLTTNNETWFKHPNVYCILAESDDEAKDVLGGIRLELLNDDYELPMVVALKNIDHRVVEMVDSDARMTTAEMCGLWNSKKVAGKKVSLLLGRAAVAFSTHIGLKQIYIFVAKYTLNYSKRLGFKIITSIGEDGNFRYPNKFFIAHVLKNTDLISLNGANDRDKDRIHWIRENWGVSCVETEEETKIMARYILE